MDLGQALDAIGRWAQETMVVLGYPGVALLMLLENLFPPLPSEIMLPLAGSLSAGDRLTLGGVIISAVIGSVGGALALYSLGRWLGEERVRRFVRRWGGWLWVSERDLDRALAWFQHRGEIAVLFARMVPGVRSLISIPAGIAQMNLLRFVLFSTMGTAIWSLALAMAGRLLGDNWRAVSGFVSQYQDVVLSIGGALLVLFVLKRLGARRISQS